MIHTYNMPESVSDGKCHGKGNAGQLLVDSGCQEEGELFEMQQTVQVSKREVL